MDIIQSSPILRKIFSYKAADPDKAKIEIAVAQNLRGPYQIGEVTAFVFRPSFLIDKSINMTCLPDTGLAGRSEGGSQEVDFGQLSPEEMKDRACDWYKEKITSDKDALNCVMAIVYNDSRRSAPELDSTQAQKVLEQELLRLSAPTGWEKTLSFLQSRRMPS